jgi:sugar phosphate isomerase/epimerase
VNRRTFVKTAAAAATLNLADQVSAAETGMYLTMRTQNGFWIPGTPPGTGGAVPLADWEGLARHAARLGFAGVDLPLLPSLQAGEEKVRAVLSELKLRTGFIAGRVNPFSGTEETFQTALKDFDEHCRFVKAIGCPRIMVVMRSSSDTPKDEWRKITLDRARAMSESMERHQVKIGFEFFGPLNARQQFKYEFIYKVPDAIEFCKDAGPNWGVCLDSWHWYLVGGTPEDIIAAGKSRINIVHIDDAKAQPAEDARDNQRLLPGEGVIPLVSMFQALIKIGYEGVVSPEPLGRFGPEVTADEAGRMTLASSIAVMKKAGVNIIQ